MAIKGTSLDPQQQNLDLMSSLGSVISTNQEIKNSLDSLKATIVDISAKERSANSRFQESVERSVNATVQYFKSQIPNDLIQSSNRQVKATAALGGNEKISKCVSSADSEVNKMQEKSATISKEMLQASKEFSGTIESLKSLIGEASNLFSNVEAIGRLTDDIKSGKIDGLNSFGKRTGLDVKNIDKNIIAPIVSQLITAIRSGQSFDQAVDQVSDQGTGDGTTDTTEEGQKNGTSPEEQALWRKNVIEELKKLSGKDKDKRKGFFDKWFGEDGGEGKSGGGIGSMFKGLTGVLGKVTGSLVSFGVNIAKAAVASLPYILIAAGVISIVVDLVKAYKMLTDWMDEKQKNWDFQQKTFTDTEANASVASGLGKHSYMSASEDAKQIASTGGFDGSAASKMDEKRLLDAYKLMLSRKFSELIRDMCSKIFKINAGTDDSSVLFEWQKGVNEKISKWFNNTGFNDVGDLVHELILEYSSMMRSARTPAAAKMAHLEMCEMATRLLVNAGMLKGQGAGPELAAMAKNLSFSAINLDGSMGENKFVPDKTEMASAYRSATGRYFDGMANVKFPYVIEGTVNTRDGSMIGVRDYKKMGGLPYFKSKFGDRDHATRFNRKREGELIKPEKRFLEIVKEMGIENAASNSSASGVYGLDPSQLSDYDNDGYVTLKEAVNSAYNNASSTDQLSSNLAALAASGMFGANKEKAMEAIIAMQGSSVEEYKRMRESGEELGKQQIETLRKNNELMNQMLDVLLKTRTVINPTPNFLNQMSQPRNVFEQSRN